MMNNNFKCTGEVIKNYAPQVETEVKNTYVRNPNFTYLTDWLAVRNGIYYMSSDVLFREVCRTGEFIMTAEETKAVEQILDAVIQADPDRYSSDRAYRLRLILNGSGAECRLEDSGLFTRNNHGNIWRSKNPLPDYTPDLLVKDSNITVEVKAYGSLDQANLRVRDKGAYNFYNANFVCVRLIKDNPQQWIWYQNVNGYYSKCTNKPYFLDQSLKLQPEICKVGYTNIDGKRCLEITTQGDYKCNLN